MRETGGSRATPASEQRDANTSEVNPPKVNVIPLHSLLPADSPRLQGEDEEHVRLLAKIDAQLPPIVVHRSTMRVIDGMHRLRAAALRGDREIAVEYFEGDELEAFVAAVQLNAIHGLPLTRTDREAAAQRIIRSGSPWSDRAIALITGLSAPTIGRLRQLEEGGSGGAPARVGLDGRVRPVSTVEGRRKAGALIAQHPNASLRQIAKGAGISVGTARDVRERVRRGESPVPSGLVPRKAKPAPEAVGRQAPGKVRTADPLRAFHELSKDPSVRLNINGRMLLKMISVSAISPEKRRRLASAVPEHCAGRIVVLAQFCSEWWIQLANEIEQRRRVDAAHF